MTVAKFTWLPLLYHCYFQSSRPSVIRKSERGRIYIMDSVTRDYHLETESDSRSFFAPIPIQRTLPPVEPIRCAASLPPRPVKRSRPHRLDLSGLAGQSFEVIF